jgi:hypothetical protein
MLESGTTSKLADPQLGGQYDVHQMQRMVLKASLCIRQFSIWRPSMSEVSSFSDSSLNPPMVYQLFHILGDNLRPSISITEF